VNFKESSSAAAAADSYSVSAWDRSTTEWRICTSCPKPVFDDLWLSSAVTVAEM